MTVASRLTPYTFDEFCAAVGDDRKADLIDGVIYEEGPELTDENQLHLRLVLLLNEFVEEKELGRVFCFKVACRLDDLNGPEPDIGFVRKERLHVVKREYVDGRPDLVMEIVSPETAEKDYRRKRRQYERAGVPEYWIVDLDGRRVTLLRLTGEGKYRKARPRAGALHSEALAGFRIRPEWLWQDSRPDWTDMLSELLGADWRSKNCHADP